VVAQKKTEPQVAQKVIKIWRGLGVADIASEIVHRFKISAETGVIVISVQPGSPAEQAGIRPGDVIYEINRTPVNSVRDYSAAIGKISGDALIGTYRGYVVLKDK
jgi:S1-C subfamily serine protease